MTGYVFQRYLGSACLRMSLRTPSDCLQTPPALVLRFCFTRIIGEAGTPFTNVGVQYGMCR